MKKILLPLAFASIAANASAQGTLSGDLMTNLNIFQNDDKIILPNNPLYEKMKSGGEGWMSLRYNSNGFTATLRVDAFQNSNLKYLTRPMTQYGIGAFSLSKEIGDLSITAGYIYDQVGSGILFRSYEDRGLLIDNALVGLMLKYKIDDHLFIKGFSGQQKNNNVINTFYGPVIKGLNIEGDYNIGKAHIAPGIGGLNRTLDETSMTAVVNTINNQELSSRFVPMYNTYVGTVYNTLTWGDFSWYAEAAYKSHEAINVNGKLLDKPGTVGYSTLGWAQKGIAINLTGKRTENFVMRTSPNQTLLDGMMNWQPIVAVIRPHRLLARYTPASQDISEQAYKGDLFLTPNQNLSATFNYTSINTLADKKLYREIYADAEYRGFKKWIISGGVQYMEYNLQVYRVEPLPFMYSFTPFGEVTYKIDNNILSVQSGNTKVPNRIWDHGFSV